MRMLSRTLLSVALIPLLTLSCMTTPEPVIQGNQAAISLLREAQVRSDTAIDAFVAETVGLNEDRYAKEFEVVEQALLAEQGNTGLVDLTRYKTLGAAYAAEMDKGRQYYMMRGEQLKQAINTPIALSLGLMTANDEYLNAAGITDELFNSLVDNSFALGSQLKTSYDAYQEQQFVEDAAEDAAKDVERTENRARFEADMGRFLQLLRSSKPSNEVTTEEPIP